MHSRPGFEFFSGVHFIALVHSQGKGDDTMAMVDRIEALKSKHEELDILISAENARPIPDNTALHAMKKQKLRIKEEMSGMRH